jgi:glycosyltransferase 2 family protein
MTLPPEPGPPRRMLNFQTVVGLLITAGIIWLGLSRINLPHTVAAFAVVRVGYVLAGGALVIAVIAILAVRWHVLLPRNPDVPIRFVFCYLMIGYMVNAIIPLRLGDLVRAYLLGRRHGIAVSTTLSTVAVERVFDIAAIVVIGFVLSTALDLPPVVVIGLRTFLSVSLIGLSVLFGLSFWKYSAERLSWFNHDASRSRWIGGLLRRLDYFCEALAVLHDWQTLLVTCLLTLAGWSVLASSLTMFIYSFGLDVTYLAGALMMVATSLGAAIPSAPGSTGVYHALTVLALSVWNVPTAAAAAVGLLAHFVTIALHIVLGLLCAWFIGIRLASLARMDVLLSRSGVS